MKGLIAIGILSKPSLLTVCDVFGLMNRDHPSNATKTLRTFLHVSGLMISWIVM